MHAVGQGLDRLGAARQQFSLFLFQGNARHPRSRKYALLSDLSPKRIHHRIVCRVQFAGFF